MNGKLAEILSKTLVTSRGQAALVSMNDNSVLMGKFECGQTADVRVGKEMIKMVLIQVPANADISIVLEKVVPLKMAFDAVSTIGVDARALVWSQRFAKGTQEAADDDDISSIELATGSISLRLPGYTHVDKGIPKPYPETKSIQALATGRGRDMLDALMDEPIGHRWTIQSLQKGAEKKSGKPISTSVIHRFFSKIKDLGLAVDDTATSGVCLTESGAKLLDETIPKIIAEKSTPYTPPNSASHKELTNSGSTAEDEGQRLIDQVESEDDL